MRIMDLDKWKEIWAVLKKNRLRTFFTAFGVFWGIFMLVIMMGSGNGLRNAIFRDMGNMATNSFFMWTHRTTVPYKGFPRGRFFNFRNGDTEAMKRSIQEIELVAPRLQAWGFRGGGSNVIRGERTGAFDVFGDTPNLNKIMPMGITDGRFLNEYDVAESRKVVVIGDRVAEEMFRPEEDPIGEYLRIQGVYFKVVGILKPRLTGNNAERDSRSIFMPITTLQKTFNMGDIVGWYSITVKEGISAERIEEKTKALMRQRHNIHPDDDRAVGSWNMAKEFRKMTGLFDGIRVLIWIVGIGTLFAGVVGVSNIMLIVVKERTREIGVQRAIGATPTDIVTQIIIESVFLTTLAGYIGLVTGVAIIEGISYALERSGAETQMFTNPEINFNMAMTSLLILVVSGVFAGMIPARRAVSIKPIDALRNE